MTSSFRKKERKKVHLHPNSLGEIFKKKKSDNFQSTCIIFNCCKYSNDKVPGFLSVTLR